MEGRILKGKGTGDPVTIGMNQEGIIEETTSTTMLEGVLVILKGLQKRGDH